MRPIFETKLNKNNIYNVIKKYLESISQIIPSIISDNAINLFLKIKRENIGNGPYPNVTYFEAANRIMSDLVILYGIKDLLEEKYPQIIFPEYSVEYGNDSKNEYDIMAKNGNKTLIGEAFNVSPAFFQGKKSVSLKKLRKCNSDNTVKIIMYNNDAVDINYEPEIIKNEYHIKVKI